MPRVVMLDVCDGPAQVDRPNPAVEAVNLVANQNHQPYKSLMFLRDHRNMPPGGLVYSQMDNNGTVVKTFSSTTMPFSQFCGDILRMRQANGYDRADIGLVAEDVDTANCVRLNGDPTWCEGGMGSVNWNVPATHKGCASCGVVIT